MTEHTPIPWIARQVSAGVWEIRAANGAAIGRTIAGARQSAADRLEIAANAYKLAAAPALLTALEHYAACSDGCTCGDGWSHDVALAAIALAKPKER